jgi:hypothetical protein
MTRVLVVEDSATQAEELRLIRSKRVRVPPTRPSGTAVLALWRETALGIIGLLVTLASPGT